MMTYKEEFISFMVKSGVLIFGDFTLKSGRQSPYFLNAGNYYTGTQLAKLGEFYADCIMENIPKFDTLFGPAYKGIPLCVSTAVALSNKYNVNVNYSFDRKEAKDHGEGGFFVGKQPKDNDRVVIIDDVTSSGKVLNEVLPKLNGVANMHIADMIVTVDRMEKAINSELTAVQQIYKEHGIHVFSIVNIKDIINAIENGVIEGKARYLDSIMDYLETYGVID